jgi:hypothetical protein
MLFVFLFVGAALWLITSMAHAQTTVTGYSNQSNSAITGVESKAAGEAQVTITGVQLQSSLSYCLIGVGRGNWHGTAAKVQIEKVGCAKPEGNKVTVPLRLEAKRYESKGAVIGYIPIGVDAEGVIKVWPDKPTGSVDFIRSNGQLDRAIPFRWSTDGKAALMTTTEANGQFSD